MTARWPLVAHPGLGRSPRPKTGSVRVMATVIPIESLRRSPYPEVFLVESGSGAFTVGDDELVIGRGHMVIVPAQTPHGFKGAGDETLRMVSIHPRET
jgi:mannose-6-phosphate isomerase-like protein (cupin superfamily)